MRGTVLSLAAVVMIGTTFALTWGLQQQRCQTFQDELTALHDVAESRSWTRQETWDYFYYQSKYRRECR